MKAYDTLWGYRAADQWLGESTGLHRTSWDSLFSLRNGFTAYGVISPAGRARCHRRPLEALASRELDASLGRQDHTLLPYASAPFVKGTVASIATRPTIVAIMIRPSVGTGWPRYAPVRASVKAKYFLFRGLTYFL